MGEFDAQKKAKELKKNVVPMHRTMDGTLNGYSLVKSFFDVQHYESQTVALDAMHEWMTTPLGFGLTTCTALLFTGLAYHAGKDEVNGRDTSMVNQGWNYTRELIQAARNGFKSVRGAVQTAALFTTQNLNPMILPTSLGLAGVYMTARVYMRSVNEARKKMLKTNEDIFQQLMNYGIFSDSDVSISELTARARPEFSKRCVAIGDPPTQFILYDEKGLPSKNKEGAFNFVKNEYIFHKNAQGKEQLYYVDMAGKVELIKDADIWAIKYIIKKTSPQSPYHLSLLQLDDLLPRKYAKAHAKKLLDYQEKETKQISLERRYFYYFIRGFNGVVDGMYLYLGIILGVAVFSPQVLIAITAISILYCLLCVASRVYEEYQNQQELIVSQYKINLATIARRLELCLVQLNECVIDIASAKNKSQWLQLQQLQQKEKNLDHDLEQGLKAFEEARARLKATCYLSRTETFLLGIKHSLPVYGALLSCVFTLTFIGSFAGFTIPAAVVTAIVILGLWILEVGVLDAFSRRIIPPAAAAIEDKKNASKLGKLVQDIKLSFKLTDTGVHEEHEAFMKRTHAKKAFLDWVVDGLQADPLAKQSYADYAEIARSFWAGISKGRKAVEMLLNYLQQRNEEGHYQDTKLMKLLIIPAAIFYAAIFTANAFVKGFAGKSNEKQDFKHQETDITSLAKILPAKKNQRPHTGKPGARGLLVKNSRQMSSVNTPPVSQEDKSSLDQPHAQEKNLSDSIDAALCSEKNSTQMLLSIDVSDPPAPKSTMEPESPLVEKPISPRSPQAFSFFNRKRLLSTRSTPQEVNEERNLADTVMSSNTPVELSVPQPSTSPPQIPVVTVKTSKIIHIENDKFFSPPASPSGVNYSFSSGALVNLERPPSTPRPSPSNGECIDFFAFPLGAV